ncbi:protease modulator HflK [Luteolibacter ambystomatis]|uniref:Protease modulator HflK n=1 Tax=Luteolibacter ambystomatis TaxID=2824561 RepID=A0A975IZQ9_9BACT|nr:protease modulator HflK [Luteolibacter ambystomatis]QUE50010.1 protease modulator HflK [Luteolibacter ambystomatis]
MRRLPLQGSLIWLEAVALAIIGQTTGQPWLLPVAGLLALLASLLSRGLSIALPAALALCGIWLVHGRLLPTVPLPVFCAVLALVLGTAFAFAAILSGLGKGRTVDPLQDRLHRLVVLFHFLAAGVLLAGRFPGFMPALWLGWSACVVSLIFTADTLVKLLARLYTPRRNWGTLAAPGAFFFFRWLGPEWRACLPVAPRDEDDSLRLQEMWMWPTVRKSLPALMATTAALVWLATGLHEIPGESAGVRHRFGTWEAAPLAPGLHTSLPWPLGGIEKVDTRTVRETVLGFRADPGQPILWERPHYEDEQRSLVGGGDDFLSISVPVFYRVADPAAYLRSSTDATGLLRFAADRVLLRLTLHLPASDLMTGAREPLRKKFQQELQQELDARSSGLHIEEVYFRDIHPPVTVAPTFQEVVSAMEDKEAFIHEGEEYRNDQLTRAKGDAIQLVTTATASAENRLSRTRGESSRFNSQLAAWRASRPLYELREGFKAFDLTLAGAKKAVFDEKLRGSIPTHLDLRKVLNPDLPPSQNIAPQSLVPRPPKSRDAFDLSIDGYLRTDRGEVPAIRIGPEDQDNLLNATPPNP